MSGFFKEMDIKLDATNGNEFWNKAWEQGSTGWRAIEQCRPFTRNMYLYLLATGVVGPREDVKIPVTLNEDLVKSETYLQGDVEVEAVKSFVKGKTVFVPLCGDTAVLRYFVDAGASHVVGADLSEMGLKANMSNCFAGVEFKREEISSVEGAKVVMYVGLMGEQKVTFFYSDILVLPKVEAFSSLKFDFAFDRAAYMAMPLELRAAYVKVLCGSMPTSGGVVMEAAFRPPETRHEGPPFHVDMDIATQQYNEAKQKNVTVTLSQNGDIASRGIALNWYAITF